MRRVAVLGAGASGYAAAISAARHKGVQVVLINREERTARKVLASGNGRCNLGNRAVSAAAYQTQDSKQLQTLLQRGASVEKFWRDLGLLIQEDAEGRLYPASNRAQTVRDALVLEAEALGVQTMVATVSAVRRQTNYYSVHTDVGDVEADAVVVALGNVAQPQLGASDCGLCIARSFGLSLAPARPSLVPLATVEHHPSLKGCRQWAALRLTGKACDRREQGEVLFAEYGLSGIAVMQLSAFAEAGDRLTLDMAPTLTAESLQAALERRAASAKYATVDKLLVGLFDRPIAYALLKDAGISPLDLPCSALSGRQITRLVEVCKGWRFTVKGPLGYDAAQVAAGGVLLRGLDQNLQCLQSTGLYFAGEVLDVTGLCGGYNLYWAWLSGIVAGNGAAVGE